MIAVIADDFTGAAELAGIGLRYRLKTELVLPGVIKGGAELLVVSTDSRSLDNKNAQMIIAGVVKEVNLLKPTLVYKKIDSVLRGHVIDELKVQMKAAGLKKAIVVPANPSLGRTIIDGKYYVHGKLIHETGFATDPEFAVTNPCVLQMIGAKRADVQVLKHTDELPSTGIVIGEASTKDEMVAWADKAGKGWLLAGAGDFFTVLLENIYQPQPMLPAVLRSPLLYVSGTSYDKSREFIKRIGRERGIVSYLPESVMKGGDVEDIAWSKRVGEMLKLRGSAIIAIDDKYQPSNISPVYLREAMARVIKEIVKKEGVKELFIEGGSTAAAILNELGIYKLTPVNELQRGVVRARAKDIYITVKPGSYELPEQIVQLYSSK